LGIQKAPEVRLLSRRLSVLVLVALTATSAFAQDQPASTEKVESAPAIDGSGRWAPLGFVPVDQAGAGRRGYAISGESADVLPAGASEFSLHTVAANNLYQDQTDPYSISQRDETHSIALGYRRGFTFRRWPRVEFGGQIQLHERDAGFLNGFISGFESMWVSLTGHTSAKNKLRTDNGSVVPLGTMVTQSNRLLYQSSGDDSGFGDLQFVAKSLLHDGADSSGGARVAARLVVNMSGASSFTQGNFAGVGVSVERRLLSWVALHGDLRASILFDRTSPWNLPLKRTTVGFSLGPELKLTANNSLSLQFDGNSTPYRATGIDVFDDSYGDVTIGLSRRMSARGMPLLVQAYARENLILPFRVRWNTDPDLAVGIKITAHIRNGQRIR
jgi:hypothetical protein